MKKRVKGFRALSEVSGLPERTLRSLWARGQLPAEQVGYRMFFFVIEKVERALERHSIKVKGV